MKGIFLPAQNDFFCQTQKNYYKHWYILKMNTYSFAGISLSKKDTLCKKSYSRLFGGTRFYLIWILHLTFDN